MVQFATRSLKMALATIIPAGTQESIIKLLAQLNDAEDQERLLEETRMIVKGYELKFGIQSEHIHDAIDSGQLVESNEVCHWLIQFDILSRARPG
jgi:hypothetical protein